MVYTLLSGLNAGASISHTFTNISSEVAAAWQAYVILNRSITLTESDYADNTEAAEPLFWNALPQVTDVQIVHNPLDNNITLSWNYPETVTGFNIYGSSIPDGGVWSFIGFTGSLSYQTPVADPILFYHIRAVNTP